MTDKQNSYVSTLAIVISACSVLFAGVLALGEDRSAVSRHEKQIPELVECSRRLEIQVEVLKEMLPRIERKVDAIDAKLENRNP